VITRSEGNPLYVEEFLRMLLDGGHVAKRDGRFVAAVSLDTFVVPATLQGLIAARLDTTPPAVKHALQRAAVVGKVFWPDAIVAQGPIDGPLEGLLLEAARRDLVSELDERGLGGGRTWTFKHILVRDVAYDAIPKTERSRAHDAFGRWLERAAGARVDEYADIVAYHADQAFLLARELGETDLQELGDRAYTRLMEAGTKAKRRGDLRAALAFFRRALIVAEAIDLPAAERLATRGLAAGARMTIEASQEVLDEIAMLVTELRASPPTAVLVDLLQVLSSDVSDKDFAAATALDREAIATARAVGDADTIADALLRSHWAWWVNGDLDASRRALLEALQHSESTGAERHLSTVLGLLGFNAAVRGAFVEGVEYSVRANERAAASGSSLQRAITLLGVVWAALWRGDLRAAVERAQQGVDAAIDAGARATIGSNYWFLGDALDAAGELGRAREAHERAIEHLSGPPSQGLRAEARTRLVKTLVRLGDLGEARRQAETSRAEVAAHDVYTLATAAAELDGQKVSVEFRDL